MPEAGLARTCSGEFLVSALRGGGEEAGNRSVFQIVSMLAETPELELRAEPLSPALQARPVPRTPAPLAGGEKLHPVRRCRVATA